MVKLFIQIPCLNEEASLPATLADLPRTVPGVDTVEILVIDDGSGDRTVAVAREAGVGHVLKFSSNQGLARAFAAGLDYCLRQGADIIVNTDADGQYPGESIAALAAPVLSGDADIVIGDRDSGKVAHFSPIKRLLQRLGSSVVRGLSGTTVPDAASGFRALSREAALRLNVVSDFTYTLETIIQAGKKQLRIAHVPVVPKQTHRPSRLFPGIPTYVWRSVLTIFRVYALYEPLKFFSVIGGIALAVGGLIGVRFTLDYLASGGAGHIQSLILAAVLILAGFQTILIGFLADLIGSSRRILEDALLRIRRLELGDDD